MGRGQLRALLVNFSSDAFAGGTQDGYTYMVERLGDVGYACGVALLVRRLL